MKAIKEEAYEEGYEKATLHIVMSMLDKGKSPEEIADTCNLSLDTVMKFKNTKE